MTERGTKISRKNAQLLSKRVLIGICIIIAVAIALTSVLYSIFLQTSEVPFSLNAAIIDQLGKEFPNPAFVDNATDILKDYGFNVSYYNESLDVAFFKGLAKYNYGIIILRAHSALREDNSTVDIFTSEEFADNLYRSELENELLVPGEFLYSPGKYYFAITSRFIENLEGRFPKSIIFAMGCWSLKSETEQLAKAFIDKGAKAYVGWTNLVLPQDTDNETLKLLRMLLNENKTLAEAKSQTREYLYKSGSITIRSRINFYPESASNLKISELITEVRTISALMPLESATVTLHVKKKRGNGLVFYFNFQSILLDAS